MVPDEALPCVTEGEHDQNFGTDTDILDWCFREVLDTPSWSTREFLLPITESEPDTICAF